MNTISLIGKKYNDTLLYTESNIIGDTNQCSKKLKRLGGMYNFNDANIDSVKLNFYPVGEKSAFIVVDNQTSTRTSYVIDEKDALLTKQTIDQINNNSVWAHMCYVDDFETHQELLKIDVPYSIDFCTLKKRETYLPIMKKAKIIFDSRERKNEYNLFTLDTPIILHDQNGVEVIKNHIIISSFSLTPMKNLNVNGAGDIYAAHFIKNYFDISLNKSCYRAMIETTKTLIERNNEEI